MTLSESPRSYRPLVIIAIVFIVSRVAVMASGVRFDMSNLNSWWQILDTSALKNDLMASLIHLHSQPPLFNALIGLILKISEQHAPLLLMLCFSSLSFAGVFAFYYLALRNCNRPFLALIGTLLLCVSPPVILFEFRLYYEGLMIWLLVIGLAFLQRCLDGGRILPGAIGFGVLAVGVLTRATLHPAWFAGVVVIALALSQGRRKTVLLAAAVPGLLIVAVMAKNLALFGSLALSSWGPINAARMTVDALPDNMRARMIADGRLSPFSGPAVFATAETYLDVAKTMYLPLHPFGHPVTDAPRKGSGDPNYNHHVYLAVAAHIGKDAVTAAVAYPIGFAARVGTALYHFNRPPSLFKGLEANQVKIELWDKVYRLTVNGQPAAFQASPNNAPVLLQIGYLQVAVLVAAGIAAIRILWMCSFGRSRLGDGEKPLLACLAVTALFLSALSVMFDVWENNRARHALDPLLLLLVLWLFRKQARTTV